MSKSKCNTKGGACKENNEKCNGKSVDKKCNGNKCACCLKGKFLDKS